MKHGRGFSILKKSEMLERHHQKKGGREDEIEDENKVREDEIEDENKVRREDEIEALQAIYDGAMDVNRGKVPDMDVVLTFHVCCRLTQTTLYVRLASVHGLNVYTDFAIGEAATGQYFGLARALQTPKWLSHKHTIGMRGVQRRFIQAETFCHFVFGAEMQHSDASV
jgi:hypothetical protein